MLLCIDFASKKAKVVGVEKEGNQLKAVMSLEFSTSEIGEVLGEFLKSTADIDEIRVSGGLEGSFHQVFTLPSLKSKELRQALVAAVIKSFGGDYQFKVEELQQVTGSTGQTNKKVMVAGVKREVLEELSGMFGDSRLKPSMYTTYPLAVQALVREMGILAEEPLAFMEIDYPTSRIVIFKGKEIRLTRELPAATEEKDSDRSALSMDIYRTLLFYGDKFPDEKVNRLVFAGGSATEETAENLKRKTGAEVIPFTPGAFFQEMEEIPYVHPGCLGLALLRPERFNFAFTPFSLQEKKKVKKTLAVSSAASLVVLLLLALIVSGLAMNLRGMNAYNTSVKGEIKLKEERLRDLALEFISQSIETSQPSWPKVFQEIAAVVPTGVALKSLTMKNEKRSWQGQVTGTADGADEITSLLLAEEVQNKFSHSPLFRGAKMTEKEVRDKKVEFKITYRLEI